MALQIIDNVATTVSNDAGTNPQSILFKEAFSSVDTTSLSQAEEIKMSFPVGVNVVNMGLIATGKYLYIKPTANVTVIFDGGAETHVFLAGKASRLWMNYTGMSLTVSGSANLIELLIAG